MQRDLVHSTSRFSTARTEKRKQKLSLVNFYYSRIRKMTLLHLYLHLYYVVTRPEGTRRAPVFFPLLLFFPFSFGSFFISVLYLFCLCERQKLLLPTEVGSSAVP